MSSTRPALPLLSLALVAASLLRLWLKAHELPEVMASHFDVHGQPDGYQSRTGFVVTSMVLELGLLGLFTVLPRFVRALPPRLINVPHREHWLSPERKEQTLNRMIGMLDYFALATLALMAATLELALRANLRRAPLESTAMWFLLVAYLGFCTVWTVRFVRSFPAPRAR